MCQHLMFYCCLANSLGSVIVRVVSRCVKYCGFTFWMYELRIRNKDWLAGTTSGSCVPWWHYAFLPAYTWVALNGKSYALMDMMMGTIFSSSLSLVICRRTHVLWCMCVGIVVSNTYRFVFFVCFVYLLLVSCVFALLVQCWQCCQYFNASSVFSDVYLI